MATAVIVERGKEEEATKGGEGEEKEGVKWEKVEVNEEGRDEEGKRGFGEREG